MIDLLNGETLEKTWIHILYFIFNKYHCISGEFELRFQVWMWYVILKKSQHSHRGLQDIKSIYILIEVRVAVRVDILIVESKIEILFVKSFIFWWPRYKVDE